MTSVVLNPPPKNVYFSKYKTCLDGFWLPSKLKGHCCVIGDIVSGQSFLCLTDLTHE